VSQKRHCDEQLVGNGSVLIPFDDCTWLTQIACRTVHSLARSGKHHSNLEELRSVACIGWAVKRGFCEKEGEYHGAKAYSPAKDRSGRIVIISNKLAFEFHNEAGSWFFPLRSDKIKQVLSQKCIVNNSRKNLHYGC
jgi:hypothetical protein